MKKSFFPAILCIMLLVSCSTTGNQNFNSSLLSKMGSEGEVVVSSSASFLGIDNNKVDEINVCFSENEIFGYVEGCFSKLTAKYVINHYVEDLNFDFYIPKRGIVFFSSIDAQEKYNVILNREMNIPYDDLLTISKSEFSIYGYSPVIRLPNLSDCFITLSDNILNAKFVCNEAAKANGLFTIVKSSYASFLSKNSIKADFGSISRHFICNSGNVIISQLNDDGFIKYLLSEFFDYGW